MAAEEPEGKRRCNNNVRLVELLIQLEGHLICFGPINGDADPEVIVECLFLTCEFLSKLFLLRNFLPATLVETENYLLYNLVRGLLKRS